VCEVRVGGFVNVREFKAAHWGFRGPGEGEPPTPNRRRGPGPG
jgi:hypothetical protein